MGVSEPTIHRQGENEIVVQLPGVKARFIQIVLKAEIKSALHLKRVQVFGKEN